MASSGSKGTTIKFLKSRIVNNLPSGYSYILVNSQAAIHALADDLGPVLPFAIFYKQKLLRPLPEDHRHKFIFIGKLMVKLVFVQ